MKKRSELVRFETPRGVDNTYKLREMVAEMKAAKNTGQADRSPKK